MSNHFHLTVRYDPNESKTWSDEEVARRWVAAFNGLPFDRCLEGPTQLVDFDLKQSIRYHDLLLDPQRVQKYRESLGSLSDFMQHLKQPFARWINKEDGCTGHAFEGRFYSGVLLTEKDILSCMAYVDLNPVEAKMAKSLREAKHTSINERLYGEKFDAEKLEAYLAPLWEDDVDVLEEEDPPNDHNKQSDPEIWCRVKYYAQQLNLGIVYLTHPNATISNKVDAWMAGLLNRERKKREQPPAFFDYA